LFRYLIALIFTLAGTGVQAEPLFPNSVVSNDLEFIKVSDPSALASLALVGRDRREMPGKATPGLFSDNVFIFEASYSDGAVLEFWAHRRFKSEARALKTVAPVACAVGRLPIKMRQHLDHVVLHTGDHTAHAEDLGRFFMIYEKNVAKRLRTHDLDETVFHESVHATLDVPHAKSRAWRRAQQRDQAVLTAYAAEHPKGEDLAETALFAYTHFKTPGRLPDGVTAAMTQLVPARLKVLEKILPLKTARDGGSSHCR